MRPAHPPQNPLIESYLTLAAEARHEIDKIKGSRFLGLARPVGSEEEAQQLVDDARAEFHDARHHCWAWRLGAEKTVFRFSDDGEPGGSAGRPILQQIEGAELVDAAVVVVRWFGGTKLGVGGLVRAYGGAAREVLERAEVNEVEVTRRLVLSFGYELAGPVQGLLAAAALEPTSSDYGERIRFTLDVPIARADSFAARFRDTTAGRGEVEG